MVLSSQSSAVPNHISGYVASTVWWIQTSRSGTSVAESTSNSHNKVYYSVGVRTLCSCDAANNHCGTLQLRSLNWWLHAQNNSACPLKLIVNDQVVLRVKLMFTTKLVWLFSNGKSTAVWLCHVPAPLVIGVLPNCIHSRYYSRKFDAMCERSHNAAEPWTA